MGISFGWALGELSVKRRALIRRGAEGAPQATGALVQRWPAPALPLQAAHNFKKTDQLCQSLKPPFPLNGFDEQESHKVKSRRSNIQIFHPKIDIFGRLYLLLNFRLTIRKYLCLRDIISIFVLKVPRKAVS